MRFFYSLIIQIYTYLIKSTSLFSKKAKLWCNGRKDIFYFLEKECAGKNIVWFHCASLGEFEQGKPLMKEVVQKLKNCTLLVTFFSPSGFEVKKNDEIADIITYLPADTKNNAIKFIQIVKPKMCFFVKYEFWFNFMYELSQNHIPFYYVSAIFREEQYFFKKYGGWFLKQLKKCSYIFVQNEESKALLLQYGIYNVMVSGDTRFDRVYEIAQQPFELEFITSFKKEKKILVAGSTWLPDEILLSDLFLQINQDYKLVITPHEVEKNHIEQIKKLFHSFSVVCYSEKEIKDISNAEILIIDTVGLLSKIYKYADISYIGGAFKTGLHNILEAAVFAKPLFFGTYYQKFNEAVELVKLGGAFSIHRTEEITQKLLFFENNPSSYQATCNICKNYITQNLGATDKIVNYIYQS
jgi:3-deoxy-D-manno-octulosonic-acid transferase